MAGLPWIKLATDAGDHPKALRLRSLLGDRRADYFAIKLLVFFARFFPAGHMPESQAGAFAACVSWDEDPERLIAALAEAGYVERRRGRIHACGWEEEHGAHVDKLERDRARMRAKRAQSRAKSSATVARGSPDRRTEEERRGDGEREETIRATKERTTGSARESALASSPKPWNEDVAEQARALDAEPAPGTRRRQIGAKP